MKASQLFVVSIMCCLFAGAAFGVGDDLMVIRPNNSVLVKNYAYPIETRYNADHDMWIVDGGGNAVWLHTFYMTTGGTNAFAWAAYDWTPLVAGTYHVRLVPLDGSPAVDGQSFIVVDGPAPIISATNFIVNVSVPFGTNNFVYIQQPTNFIVNVSTPYATNVYVQLPPYGTNNNVYIQLPPTNFFVNVSAPCETNVIGGTISMMDFPSDIVVGELAEWELNFPTGTVNSAMVRFNDGPWQQPETLSYVSEYGYAAFGFTFDTATNYTAQFKTVGVAGEVLSAVYRFNVAATSPVASNHELTFYCDPSSIPAAGGNSWEAVGVFGIINGNQWWRTTVTKRPNVTTINIWHKPRLIKKPKLVQQ